MKTSSVSSSRVFGLDLFRCLAIISVMYGHQAYLLKGDLQIPGNLIPSGVEWFFVLSGFLIGQIIIRDFDSKLKGKDLIFFLKRRWYRTLPNYYLFLMLNFFLAYFGLTSSNPDYFSWKFLLFFQNFSHPFTDFFWESWSLSIEEWFYILFPLSFFFLLRYTKLDKRKSLIGSMLLLIIVPIIIKLIRAPQLELDGFWFDNILRKVVVYRLDSVIYGVLMAYIKVYFSRFWYQWKWPMLMIAICYLQLIFLRDVELNSLFDKVFRLPLNSLAIALLIPFFDGLSSAPKLIRIPIEWLSKISYSLYLIHLGIVIGLINHFSNLSNSSEILFYNVFFWIACLLLASGIYYFFEKPITGLRPAYKSKSE